MPATMLANRSNEAQTMSTLLNIDMQQFRRKWKDYSDNVKFGEVIRLNKGHFWALDQRPYIEWLTEFGINFTCGFYMGNHIICPRLPINSEE